MNKQLTAQDFYEQATSDYSEEEAISHCINSLELQLVARMDEILISPERRRDFSIDVKNKSITTRPMAYVSKYPKDTVKKAGEIFEPRGFVVCTNSLGLGLYLPHADIPKK